MKFSEDYFGGPDKKDDSLEPPAPGYTRHQYFLAIDGPTFDNWTQEERKSWLLEMLKTTTKQDIFWRGNYSAQAIYYLGFYKVKQYGMYKDPVRSGIVTDERYYKYSSCSARYDNQECFLPVSEVARRVFIRSNFSWLLPLILR